MIMIFKASFKTNIRVYKNIDCVILIEVDLLLNYKKLK